MHWWLHCSLDCNLRIHFNFQVSRMLSVACARYYNQSISFSHSRKHLMNFWHRSRSCDRLWFNNDAVQVQMRSGSTSAGYLCTSRSWGNTCNRKPKQLKNKISFKTVVSGTCHDSMPTATWIQATIEWKMCSAICHCWPFPQAVRAAAQLISFGPESALSALSKDRTVSQELLFSHELIAVL